MQGHAPATTAGTLGPVGLPARRSGGPRARAAVFPALLVLAACATPVGVRHADPRTVYREQTVNALAEHEPSAATRQVLERMDLTRRYQRDPEAALQELRASLGDPSSSDRLFALAELCFLHAEDRQDPGWYLASLVSAYAFLFPEDPALAPQPFDSRLRVAADLYNRALTLVLLAPGAGQVLRDGGTYRFPFGEIEIEAHPESYRWGQRQLEEFVSLADLEVRGLRNRYRRPGIGAPLAARVAAAKEGDHATARLGQRRLAPVTFFLRIESPRQGLREGRLRARLEFYTEYADQQVSIGGEQVPLEVETSAALASTLQGSRLWDAEIAGFRSADLLPDMFQGLNDGLFMLEPYRRGSIPVVLVHGTASSPARWAEMVNELESYPEIRERYQIWLFLYATGNPILYSAHLLRESLTDAVAELDPRGSDPALRRMVVIGHSQGGLLAKALVTHSGTAFWNNVSDVPFDEASRNLDPETVALLKGSFFFEPLPFVKRVIFIATPHHGSFLARGVLGSLAAGMVELPGNLVQGGVDLVSRSESLRLRHRLDRMPSSVDNMRPDDPFTRAFSAIPVDPGVAAHSIIAVKGDGPVQEGNDGVVEYTSAHIDEAVSELVVRSGHSVQGNPLAILEVRRILLLHLGAS